MTIKLSSICSLIFILSCFACKKEENACENVVCATNESCVDGICICNHGENCNPDRSKRIEINSIEIIRFPNQTVSGNQWVTTTGPDLHLTVYQSTEALFILEQTINDAVKDSVYMINCDPPIRLENYLEQHTLALYDDDGNQTDQFMGGLVFKPHAEGAAQTTFKIVDINGPVAFKLNWQFFYI